MMQKVRLIHLHDRIAPTKQHFNVIEARLVEGTLRLETVDREIFIYPLHNLALVEIVEEGKP